MTTNDNKYYLGYLDKLIDQYNNTYHRSIGREPFIMIILLWLKKLNRVIKLLNLKLVIESVLLSTSILSAKVAPKLVKRNICY